MPEQSPYARQIMERCDVLAGFTTVEGQITRPYGTTALAGARDQIAVWIADAGMSTRVDTVGNLIGRYEADPAIPEPKTFVIGGHFDSVVDAGRYDGILGVLSGIAAVARLRDTGVRLPFAIEVLAVVDEEGNRFHTSFLGSSPLAGQWDPAWLDLADDEGVTLREAISAWGGDPDAIGQESFDPATLLGFVEMHIEQGPVLEAEDLPVAVVSSITGSARATMVVHGMAGHVGTVPMGLRRDALAAAAEIVLAVEDTGRSEPDLVATVGRMEVGPGAPNVIPGRVEMTLDLRHSDPAVRERAIGAIREAGTAIAERRGVRLQWIDAPGFEGITCDDGLSTALGKAIAAEGYRSISLYSGAGHDALTLAKVAPVSMLLVRCKEGISHNPAESISVDDVDVAMRVLDRFLLGLAGRG
jgi:allantoate deiminase